MAILPKFVRVSNLFPWWRSNAIFPLNEIVDVNASNIYTIEQTTTHSVYNNSDAENISLKNCDCSLNVPQYETSSSSISYNENAEPNIKQGPFLSPCFH